jgi:predicted benzoate:H+ symporter BenE
MRRRPFERSHVFKWPRETALRCRYRLRLLFLVFGILAPVAADLSSTLPITFIAVLGGLALIRALQSWMASAFGGDLSLGALTAFLLTLSGISIFGSSLTHVGKASSSLPAMR